MYTLKSRQGGIVVRRWQLFLGIELALTLWLFFQIITNPMALTTILVGVFFLLASVALVQCGFWRDFVSLGNFYQSGHLAHSNDRGCVHNHGRYETRYGVFGLGSQTVCSASDQGAQ